MYSKTSPETIKKMFTSIASSYDGANFFMSFGLYKLWNRRIVNEVIKKDPKKLLDLCAGTGAIAFGFLKKKKAGSAFLLDFCSDMLEVARKKGEKRFKNRFTLLLADAQKIPLGKECVDAITMAYGIRNVKEPTLCFKEGYRLLKSGGSFYILELTLPQNKLLKSLHSLHLKLILPFIGKVISKNKEAYSYLSESVKHFSSPIILKESLKSVGFDHVEVCPLMGGIATLLIAKKI